MYSSEPTLSIAKRYLCQTITAKHHWQTAHRPLHHDLSEGDADNRKALSLCIETKTEDERVYDDQRLKSKNEVLKSNAWPSREQRQQYFHPDHCSLISTPLNIYALKCLNRLLCWTLRENQRISRVPLKSDFGQPFHHP